MPERVKRAGSVRNVVLSQEAPEVKKVRLPEWTRRRRGGWCRVGRGQPGEEVEKG